MCYLLQPHLSLCLNNFHECVWMVLRVLIVFPKNIKNLSSLSGVITWPLSYQGITILLILFAKRDSRVSPDNRFIVMSAQKHIKGSSGFSFGSEHIHLLIPQLYLWFELFLDRSPILSDHMKGDRIYPMKEFAAWVDRGMLQIILTSGQWW